MKLFAYYINSFKGFRTEVWWLALVVLINRAGTMVIPFLSLYLTEDLHLTLDNVGWIMVAFGSGAVIGSWIGGRLCDNIGFYKVMIWSLILSGILFVALQYTKSMLSFGIGIFVIMIVSDSFRPAAYVAINAYSKPENRTRAVTLIRLAINLGFSMGPAVGGLIISTIGYGGLFWVDGLTCISAGLLILLLLYNRQAVEQYKNEDKKLQQSPYNDGHYLLFILIVFIIAFAFLQLFSTIPLYYRNVHHLSESQIGLLLALNGALIFIMEMPFIKYLEQSKYSIYKILIYSTLLIALSFLSLNLFSWTGIIVIGMLFITYGEMFNFPFLNRFALDRAQRGKSGAYMALFTMSFSAANIFSHKIGLYFIEKYGYEFTWYFMTGDLILAMILLLILKRKTKLS